MAVKELDYNNETNKTYAEQIEEKFTFWTMWLTTILYPLWGIFTPMVLLPDAIHDGFLHRLAPCVFSLIGLVVVYTKGNIGLLRVLATLSIFSIAAHYFYLCYVNSYHRVYLNGSYIVIVSLMSLISRKNDLIFLAILCVAGASLSWLENLPVQESLFFVFGITTSAIVLGFVNSFRMSVIHKLDKTNLENEENKRIAYHQSKLASLGRIAAGVGHEINNPTAIIKGHIDILARVFQNESSSNIDKLKTTLTKIDMAVNRIVGIVNGLKSYARFDTPSYEIFDVSALVHETIELMSNILLKEKIKLKTDVKSSLYTNGNRGQIQQVIVNLLTNAKDAISAERKEIIVTVLEDPNQISIYIEDTGSGVDDKIRNEIFEPFFTTKEVNKGTGLGLGISYEIINEHRGELSLESTSPVGSTFKISLTKASDQEVNHSLLKKINSRPKGDSHYQGLNETTEKFALVVDDEENIQEILESYLVELGYSCVCCGDGDQAWKILHDNPKKFDLLITDVQMPNLDGLQLLEKINASSNINPYRVLVTGGSRYKMDYHGAKKPYDTFVLKPFTIGDIKTAISLVKSSKNKG